MPHKLWKRERWCEKVKKREKRCNEEGEKDEKRRNWWRFHLREVVGCIVCWPPSKCLAWRGQLYTLLTCLVDADTLRGTMLRVLWIPWYGYSTDRVQWIPFVRLMALSTKIWWPTIWSTWLLDWPCFSTNLLTIYLGWSYISDALYSAFASSKKYHIFYY